MSRCHDQHLHKTLRDSMHSTSSSADSYTRRLASSVASRLFSPGKRKQLNQRVASPNKLEAGPQKPHSRRVAKVMACIRKRRFAELSKASPLQSTRTLRCTRRSAGARETGETDEDEVEKERLKQLLADLGDFKNASTFEMKHRVEAQDLRLENQRTPISSRTPGVPSFTPETATDYIGYINGGRVHAPSIGDRLAGIAKEITDMHSRRRLTVTGGRRSSCENVAIFRREAASRYQPAPLDLRLVALPASLNSVILRCARESHQQWCDARVQAGWKFGRVLMEETKEHPLLLPFDALSLDAQAVNRKNVTEICKVMLYIGFEILPTGAGPVPLEAVELPSYLDNAVEVSSFHQHGKCSTLHRCFTPQTDSCVCVLCRFLERRGMGYGEGRRGVPLRHFERRALAPRLGTLLHSQCRGAAVR